MLSRYSLTKESTFLLTYDIEVVIVVYVSKISWRMPRLKYFNKNNSLLRKVHNLIAIFDAVYVEKVTPNTRGRELCYLEQYYF